MANKHKPTEAPTSAAELQQQYALDRTVLANERTYRVLDEIVNTQPAVNYLKKVTFHEVAGGHE